MQTTAKAGELKRKKHKEWAKPGSSLAAKAAMMQSQKDYKALIRREKRAFVKTQIDMAADRSKKHRTKAVFQWFKHAEGKAEGAASKAFLGQRAKLKYRHFNKDCKDARQVAAAVSDFTEEVSLGRDLLGNMDDDYKAEVSSAQATIMGSETADGEASPITTQHIKAAIKKLKKKLRKAAGKDGLTNWMLVWAGLAIVQPLKLLFTAMWESNLTPNSMKEVLVKYIPKGSRPSL